MPVTTPVRVILLKKTSKSLHVCTNGARPDSGNANTEFRRAESKPVSSPCTNGDDAASAIRCGMKRLMPCSITSASSALGQPTCTCWPKMVNCLDR